jgi:glutamate-1-semialdehyde 2,1-aminomutase
MEMIAPAGPVYQAGTLSGNPLAMSAGFVALNYIKDNPNIYNKLEEKSSYLEAGIKENLKQINKKLTLNRVGSMLTLFFTKEEVKDFNSAVKSDAKLYGKYFHEMLQRGVYLPPAQFEAFFVSTAHSKEDLDKTIKANYEALRKVL